MNKVPAYVTEELDRLLANSEHEGWLDGFLCAYPELSQLSQLTRFARVVHKRDFQELLGTNTGSYVFGYFKHLDFLTEHYSGYRLSPEIVGILERNRSFIPCQRADFATTFEKDGRDGPTRPVVYLPESIKRETEPLGL